MKKRFLSLCITSIAVLLLTQCKKDDTSASTAESNYAPTTTNSSWTYNYAEGSAAPNTFKITATSRDTFANGKTYKVFSNSDGTTSYMAKVGNDYYRLASFPSIGITSFEELYLKGDQPVGGTWAGGTANFKYAGQNIAAALADTIKGKGESRTVNGKAFNNVTHVRAGISLFGSNIGGGDFYYQDGVGLIEDNILILPPLSSPFNSIEQIVSYDIK